MQKACHSKLMAQMYLMASGCDAQKCSGLGPRYSVSENSSSVCEANLINEVNMLGRRFQ